MKTIELTQGKVTLVDDDVYEWASKLKWHVAKRRQRFYAARHAGIGASRHYVLLHREIMKAAKGVQVDHEDGDGLNNLWDNLRVATNQQNHWAYRKSNEKWSSKFRGVSWDAPRQKWKVQISIDEKNTFIGRFLDEQDAARAYDTAARLHYGEFAQPNFLFDKALAMNER